MRFFENSYGFLRALINDGLIHESEASLARIEEFQSYLLEAYAAKPQSLSETVQKAVRDLVALIRATLFRYGFNLNSFSVADLAAIARGSLSTTTNLTGISSKLVDADPLFSQSAMKSVEANIKRGRDAMTKALLDKTSVHRAMFRNGLGWVDFVWGDEGGKIKKSGKRPGAKGIAHILEARQRKDDLSKSEAEKMLFNLVDTVAKGEEVTRYEQGNSINISLVEDRFRVYLAKNKGSNAWIVTGFEDFEPDSDGSGQDAPPPTRPESTLTRN